MNATQNLNAEIPAELINELDLFLTNTGLDKNDQKRLIEIINKIYYSVAE
jgi:hypothetical protein